MRGESAERINLLGNLHRAQFRRDCRTYPTRNHQRRQYRGQLAGHGHAHDRAARRVHLHLVELVVDLIGKHHSREYAGDDNDGLRLPADLVDLLDGFPPARSLRKGRLDDIEQEQQHRAELVELANYKLPETCKRHSHVPAA